MSARDLLERNRAWVAECAARDPDYFRRQASRHRPQTLYIGCSDARGPAEHLGGVDAGEMFVHRNIANQVVPTDANLLAVVQYAVEILEVRDIIVCGHEHCRGVNAAVANQAPSHVEGWLAHVRTVASLHQEELATITELSALLVRLVELNVREQVNRLSRLPVIQSAWSAGRELNLHGWVYAPSDGLLRDLRIGATDDGSRWGRTRKAG